MQILPVSFIGCLVLLTAAKYSIGLIKQLFPPVLNFILVYIKLPQDLHLRYCLRSEVHFSLCVFRRPMYWGIFKR